MDFYTAVLFMLCTIESYTSQCGENRHTDIVSFCITRVYINKPTHLVIFIIRSNTVCGHFYHTVW